MIRRHSTIVGALCVALGACGGGSAATTTIATTTTAPEATTTTTEPGFEVTSDDGRLTVSVPQSAAAADPGITIIAVGPEGHPSGLQGLPPDAAVRVYELGPDGHEFAAPVTVTLRMTVDELGGLAPNEIPVVVLLTTDAAGGFEVLGDLSVTRHGSDLVVTGTTAHFSPIVEIRESSTAVVSLDRESLEALPTGRAVQDILELMTEAPGTIPVTAGFRDSGGQSITGTAAPITVDGLPFTTRGAAFDIRCDDIAEIEVLPISFGAEFGSEAIAGVVNLLRIKDLSPDPFSFDMELGLAVRARCLDPSSSILGLPLSGFEIATDHPGDMEWISGGDFLGGLSGSLIATDRYERLVKGYIGLICDNDGNGIVDPTDTMFPAYPLTEGVDGFEAVSPLFGQADYFVYLYDAALFSGLPAGSGWAASDGLSQLESMYTGPGRFESALGVVSLGMDPFVYTVGADEPLQQVDGATLRMFEFLRSQLRF